MKSITGFFTFYWIIYYPTCIAFYGMNGLSSSIDEAMTIIFIAYTFSTRRYNSINSEAWKEYFTFLLILLFYVAYSIILQITVWQAVALDFIQHIRPFSIIYCTWILNPQFTEKQKKWIITSMIATLGVWILLHPSTTQIGSSAEFPVLGQMAICTGMTYYLLSEETLQNKYIALALAFTGLLAPKFKFMGELVCFVALLFYVKKPLNLRSPKAIVSIMTLMALVIAIAWERFEIYYVDGWSNEGLARPMTYKTSLLILWDYFPLGPGMGTFAGNGAMNYYSPLYYKYNLNNIWGLTPTGTFFVCDAFYPTMAQFGVIGVILFIIFWKRRLADIYAISDMRYYRVAFTAFFCLAIEQTADSSWLSGKGMGYCMLIGLCLNANRNKEEEEDEEEGEEEEDEDEEDEL